METTGLLVLSKALLQAPARPFRRTFLETAGSLAALVGTRLTYATSGGILIALAAWRARRPWLLLSGIPAALILGLHLLNNQKHFQDPIDEIRQSFQGFYPH
jgi:hypothetical protein